MNSGYSIAIPDPTRIMVGTIGVADANYCRDIASRVFSMRQAWIPRAHCSTTGGFATLGCATYLDVGSSPSPERDYYCRLFEQNQLLMAHFGDLLDRMRVRLGIAFKSDIKMTEDFALPGFHIFWGTSLVDEPTPDLSHFDTQFQMLPWSGYRGISAPKSFTLPVCLPDGGASLDLWPITYREFLEGPGQSRSAHQYARDTSEHCRTHFYELGICTIQNDLWLHRIGRCGTRGANDYRITLQGHLFEIDGQWIAYW